MKTRDAALIVVLALLVFAPSLGGAFVYDDNFIVAMDARVQRGDLAGALGQPYWAERHGGLYRPVTTLSFVAQGLVSLDPLGFRVVNLALHAAASVLALALALRITGSRRAAFLAAALFAVHPIHVEVVANVVGRSESLGFVLAGLAWLIAVPAAEERSGRRLALATLLAMLGMLSKENALAVALAAPLEAVVFRRRGAVLAAVPAVLGLLLALAARRAALGGALTPEDAGIAATMNPLVGQPLAVRAANAPLLLLVYLKHLALPIALAPDYGGSFLPLATGLEPRVALWALGALALLAAPPLVSGRRGLFASAFLLLALGPVLQLITIGTLLGDRLAYAASFGFALALAQARPPRTAAALVLGLLAAVAVHDARAWMDMIGLFRRSVARAPGSFQIPYVLGQLLAQKEDRVLQAEGADLLARAAVVAPGDAQVFAHLGVVEHKLGRIPQAAEHLERSLALRPREEGQVRSELARVLAMLGSARAARGDRKGARSDLERSLALDPSQEKADQVRKILESLPKD